MLGASGLLLPLRIRKNCPQMISAAAARLLSWSRSSDPRLWLTPARHAISRVSSQPVEPHTHDFHEVFWIEEGQGEHLINGQRHPLRPGDCVFIRASDQHGMRNAGEAPFTWTNVTLRADAEARLRATYEPDLGWWPWRREGPPHVAHLSPGQIGQLTEQAASLPLRTARQIDQEWFVASLMRVLVPPELSGGMRAPAWLLHAVRQTGGDPARLRDGPNGLVALCGRCPEHVNRVVREHYGLTTTDLVRNLRLAHAARLLRFGEAPILDIALECGFGTLSYFYRCFVRHYRVTPRHYRLQRV
jgi:AraC family transcriptional regulator, dual regulator of chb operon